MYVRPRKCHSNDITDVITASHVIRVMSADNSVDLEKQTMRVASVAIVTDTTNFSDTICTSRIMKDTGI